MNEPQEGPLFDDERALSDVHAGFAALLDSNEATVADGVGQFDIRTMSLESFIAWLCGLAPELSAMAKALPPETLVELFDAMFIASLADKTP